MYSIDHRQATTSVYKMEVLKMNRVQIVSVKLAKEKTAMYETTFVNSPTIASNIVSEYLDCPDREHFVILCLDTKNKVNTIHTVSIGTLDSSLVHPREVFMVAILANTKSIILAHNHPSGDTSPSKEDLHVTKRLQEAGNILGIDILDHIVIGDNGRYTSFKEQGLI